MGDFIHTLFQAITACSILLITFSLLDLTQSFNVDTASPVVITNHAAGEDSYFGSSLEVVQSRSGFPWIIIGAPTSNSTYWNKKQVTLHQPGEVWKCSFGAGNDACEPLVVDPVDVYKANVTANRRYIGNKNSSMLGLSMASGSSSDAFVTCAPRWSNEYPVNFLRNEVPSFNGACYMQSKVEIVEPNFNGSEPERMYPLADIPMQVQNNGITGMAGFAAHFTKTGELLLGAPGYATRKGSVLRYENAKSGDFQNFTFSGPPDLIKNDTYFGWSVNSGKFFADEDDSSSGLQYVASAPRGEGMSGHVVIFDFPKPTEKKLHTRQEFKGPHIGSNFGSTLCVVDINNDGYDDLLIGAPRTTKSSRIRPVLFGPDISKTSQFVQIPSAGDEGVVYVYISDGRQLKLQHELSGDSEAYALFGTAIVSAGDLNQDGYNDVVIGAPSNNTGPGAIYIYLGGHDGLEKYYSQAIEGRDFNLDLPFAGFGSSIAAGKDLDRNDHADLIIGAPASNQVVVLRTKPPVQVTTTLTSFPKRLPFDVTNFTLQACLNFTGHANIQQGATFQVTLLLDVNVPISKRVSYAHPSSPGKPTSTIVFEDTYFRNVNTCKNFTLQVVKNILDHNPVRIIQQVTLDPAKTANISNSNRGATLIDVYKDDEGQLSTQVTGTPLDQFCIYCPFMRDSGKISSSAEIYLDFACRQVDKCIADFSIEALFEKIPPGGSFLVGSAPEVTLSINITNSNDVGLGTLLRIEFADRLLIRIPKQCKSTIPRDTSIMRSQRVAYLCGFSYVFKANTTENIKFQFDMADLSAGRMKSLAVGTTEDVEAFFFHLEVTSITDLMGGVEMVEADVILPLSYEAKPVISAGVQQIIPFSLAGVHVFEKLTHHFEISLEGPTPIAYFVVLLHVPTMYKKEGKVFNVTNVLVPKALLDGEEMYCYPRTGEFFTTDQQKNRRPEDGDEMAETRDEVVLQTAGFSFLGGKKDRIKRETKLDVEHHHRKNASVLTLNCHGSSSVECMEIVCRFGSISSKTRAYIKIDALIYAEVIRGLFVLDDRTVQIDVESKATLTFASHAAKPASAYAVTSIRLDQPQKVQQWIYIVSALVGILLLAVIVAVISHYGFFDRKKTPPQEENDEQEAQEESLLAGPEPGPNDISGT